MASDSGGASGGPHATTARRHGAGAGRTSEQKHRRRSRHQPAYGRKPPRLDHEEDWVEVAPGASSFGVSRLGRRGSAATTALNRRRRSLLVVDMRDLDPILETLAGTSGQDAGGSRSQVSPDRRRLKLQPIEYGPTSVRAVRSRSGDLRAFSLRGYGREPRVGECDHRRFWLRPELAPKGSPQGRPIAKTRTRTRRLRGRD